jgi:hypothetical protein
MMAKETEREEPEFVQQTKAAGEAMMKQWKSLIPKEFWEHRRTARRETLLALRSLVDAAIERLEDSEENPRRRRSSSSRKVKVEVD